MKKTSKRIIATVLAVVMIFSACGVGVISLDKKTEKSQDIIQAMDGSNIINADSVDDAVELMENNPELFSDSSDETLYPTIILPGISQSISYVADENGEPAKAENGSELSGGLLIIDTSNLASIILENLAFPLVKALVTQKDEDKSFQNAVAKTISEVFSVQASDNEGNPISNLKTVEYNSSVEDMSQEDKDYFYRMIPMKHLTEGITDATTGEYSSEPILDADLLYLYAFPLIGDPMESARGLDEYIQFVKEDAGASKVNLVTVSLGGTILTAYMELMAGTGYPDINRVVNVVSCLQGTDIMGDFFMRKFKINDPEHPEYEDFFFNDFLPMVMEQNADSKTIGYLINIALKIFSKEVVYSLLSGAVDGIIDTLMLKCPQFWAMLPTDRFDEVKAKYSFLWEDAETYGVLTAKIEAFQKARLNLVNNLKEFNTTGDRVSSVAGYNLSYAEQDYNFFGAMRSSDVTNSDGIIDIDSTTLGATYAKAGSVLSGGKRLSPDGSVDASTCAFPDNVWFFNQQYHEVGRNDVVLTLVGKIIVGDIKSVNDDPDNFPQFNGNRNTRNLTRWRLSDAELIITTYDAEKGTAEVYSGDGTATVNVSAATMDSLVSAYKDALNLINNTICEPTEAEKITIALENALYRVSNDGNEPPVEDTTGEQILEIIVKIVNDIVVRIFGTGYGFSEFLRRGYIA